MRYLILLICPLFLVGCVRATIASSFPSFWWLNVPTYGVEKNFDSSSREVQFYRQRGYIDDQTVYQYILYPNPYRKSALYEMSRRNAVEDGWWWEEDVRPDWMKPAKRYLKSLNKQDRIRIFKTNVSDAEIDTWDLDEPEPYNMYVKGYNDPNKKK